MISLQRSRWLFGSNWDNGFLSELVTCIFNTTLWILPGWHLSEILYLNMTPSSMYIVLLNIFNINKQKVFDLTHILVRNMMPKDYFRIKELTHYPLEDAVVNLKCIPYKHISWLSIHQKQFHWKCWKPHQWLANIDPGIGLVPSDTKPSPHLFCSNTWYGSNIKLQN